MRNMWAEEPVANAVPVNCPFHPNYHERFVSVMASSAFRENVDLLGVIRSILDNYPFSAGLLREILQNSDDAKATEQVFVLDCRAHPSERVWNADVVDAQGPALLAYNNASFQPEDWKALQDISRSSKKEDTSKIGKFGIGIRSCYHIADFLQVLSGEDLVILDPQRLFSEDGGVRLQYKEHVEKARDHFLAFRHFLPSDWDGESFSGTVVRLPLRTQPGDLREKTVSPQEIRQLFQDFIRDEIDMAMLFLQHLKSIEFIVIDKDGKVEQLARSTLGVEEGLEDGTLKKTVHVHVKGAEPREERWLLIDSRPSAEEAMSKLTSRAGELSARIMKKNKLRPHVGIAFPIPSDSHPVANNIGQLFTFLRLPLATGFPGHVHAYFALTPSRQNLRNPGDNGVVKGSDDYILIQWNKLLFQEFIPRAWSQLLDALSRMYPSVDTFSAWPTPQSFSTCGESVYWKAFTNDVLQFVLQGRLAVWPTVGGHGYHPLDDVLVASPATKPEVLTALADVGVKVSGPIPQFLFDMISGKSEWKNRILTPESASDALRRNFIPALAAASERHSTELAIILEYLLSSGNFSNIFGLPIVPTVSKQFVALFGPAVSPKHTLLDKGEYDVFKPCDADAIYIESLPESTRKFFKQSGPANLNVRLLDPPCVVEYLSVHPALRCIESSAEPGDDLVGFLSQFWLWFDNWGHRSELLPRLQGIRLVPCLQGMKEADRKKPVFELTRALNHDPDLLDFFSKLGVPFLTDNEKMDGAKKVLLKYGMVKSPEEIKPLLECLSRSDSDLSVAPTTTHLSKLLLKYFNAHMPKTRLRDYSEVEVETFRMLPIFPIVEWDRESEGEDMALKWRYSAVHELTAYGVETFGLLPLLPNTVFVDVKALNRNLLPALNGREPAPLSDMKILELSIKRFDQQPKRVLMAILKHVAAHERELTGTIRDALRSQRFIQSVAGPMKAPKDLVDSASPLYPLYVHDRERLPHVQDDEDRRIVESLAKIGLLDRALSKENVEDRIRYVASHRHFELSVQLLNILYTTGFDCRALTLDSSLTWLPALKGSLVTAAECRPGRNQGGIHDERLFDQVLERVHSGVPMVPPTLKAKVGWDAPIPVGTLVKQLVLVLDNEGDNVVARVEVVILELSKRSLDDAEWGELKTALEGRRWVPVSGVRGDQLVEAWRAVFSSVFPGIYQVKAGLLTGRGKNLLRALGCLDRPTLETVKRRLAQLAGEEPASAVTSRALDVLQFAVTLDLNEEERTQLLVPDQRNQLHPIQQVVYNDVGSRSLVAKLPEGQHIASPRIDDELARSLRLERLGLKFVFLQELGEDMGVSPATVVRKTLEQYTDKQFLPEFLANAEDAGATTFEVILNDATSSRGPFLSSALGRLYSGPSVLVCNDSEFTEKDFHGICRTHIGGKVDKVDTIGQFGLGALTMFHVTECPIIFSGTSMLILDPAKSHLPIRERASLILPLKDVIDLYSGHVECLRGLSCFDADAKRVNGTVFFLPLRSRDHTIGRKPFRAQNYTVETFQETILRDFQYKARECLLFIKLSHIRARRRTPSQRSELLWSVDVRRSEEEGSRYTTSNLVVETQSSPDVPRDSVTWLVVSDIVPAGDIPPDIKTNDITKSVKVGLAAPLNDGYQFFSKFFAMLPLAISVGLPVHVNASFKMSSDRRQIRLDAYDNDETRFNRWLLTDQLPQLYLALLEILARYEGNRGNSRWWPGASIRSTAGREDEDENDPGNEHHDYLTAMLIEHFYKTHLPQSTRPVCCPMYPGGALKFSEVVFYPSYSRPTLPPVIKEVFNVLRPSTLVKLPVVKKHADECGATIAGPGFVKQLLMVNRNARAVREHLVNDFDRSDLLRYLASPDPSHLEGLPLLLLEGRTWTKFETGATGRMLYRWDTAEQLVRNNVFPGHRFVHANTFPPELLEGPAGSVNVETLTAAAVKELAQECIDSLSGDPTAMSNWLGRFWQAYSSLPTDGLPKAIESLPLVPTTGGSFNSLLQVKGGEALLTSALEEDWLRECFQDLGIPVLDQRSFTVALTDLIRYGDYKPTEPTVMGSFLCSVSPILQSALRALRQWSSERHDEFAVWAKRNIISVQEQHMETAQRLPIWPSRKGATTSLRSANEVKLLPAGVSLEIGRFCPTFVTDQYLLSHLEKKQLNVQQLYGLLHLNGFLQEGQDEAVYRHFFEAHLLHSDAVNKPLVPNSAREMVAPDNLFEHSDFFDAALGLSSPYFLLPSFDTFSRHLPLKRDADVKIDLFERCARAFQDSSDQDKIARGRIVYEKYHRALPLHTASKEKWQQLDRIRFIPRNIATTRQYVAHEVELPQSVRNLPPLVSPSEVVLTKYYPVAWTQRALLASEPEPRLTMVYPEFGCPSAGEVVAHLRELIHLPQRSGFVPDLTATYQWLNEEENIGKVAGIVADMKDEPIFLNVDDPSTDEWAWCAANQLALESHDLSAVRAVRDYLKPFRRLLKAAGVLEAFYPAAEEVDKRIKDSQELAFLKRIRTVFNEQRSDGRFTDVVFTPSSGHVDNTLRGHRDFLAGCSEMFNGMFGGNFKEAQEATPSSPLVVNLPHSAFAIKTVLDYLYTGEAFPPGEELVLANLLEALGMASYLGVDGLFDLVQREITKRKLVDPNTLKDVRECAQALEADILIRWLDEYEEKNANYIIAMSQE